MKRILVFKTSSDSTMYRLFEEIIDGEIDCLIQSSQIRRYEGKYQNINFIDIKNEGFYDLPSAVLKEITKIKYDEIYITFSGTIGHNYGNVIEILQQTSFEKAFFYNCDGNRTSIPKPNVLKDSLCRVFIWIVQFFWQ